jgi:hypothetical protein
MLTNGPGATGEVGSDPFFRAANRATLLLMSIHGPEGNTTGLAGPVRATVYYRRSGLLFIAAGIVIAVAVLLLHLVTPLDAFGLGFGGFCGLLLVARGLWRLRAGREQHPESVVYQTLNSAPASLQQAWLRRWIPLGAVAFVVLSIMTAQDLLSLERAGTESVRVWAPVAWVFARFGFWPAVTAVPVIGGLSIWVLWRRYRRVSEGERREP